MRRRLALSAALARDARGATALELALVLPVFLALLLGVFDLGYAFYSGAAVRNAVQHAARGLIADPNTSASTMTASVRAMLVDVPVQDLALSVSKTTIGSANVARVSWTYDYPLAVPLMPSQMFVFGSSLTVPLS